MVGQAFLHRQTAFRQPGGQQLGQLGGQRFHLVDAVGEPLQILTAQHPQQLSAGIDQLHLRGRPNLV
jgi:hypothetical protein